MIYVTGADSQGIGYAVYLDADAVELADQGIVMPAELGETVLGTPLIVAAIEAAEGSPVFLTPTGPAATVARADADSVVAWLRENTDARVATGMEASFPAEPLATPTPGDQVVF